VGRVKSRDAAAGALLAIFGLVAAVAATADADRAVGLDGVRHIDPARPCGVARRPPAIWRHVIWIVFENKAYDEVIGSPEAPYLSVLASRCGVATNFRAEAHPSLPNYIAMTSGSTHGVNGDGPPSRYPLSVPNIFSQLGTGWRVLQESMPANCDRSDSGSYAVRHNPATYYTNVSSSCSTQDVPLGPTPELSARFTFITPNICNDMHNCGVGVGDAWLSHLLPEILGSPQYQSGSTAIFITWDEDDFHSDQHIPTIVISPSTPAHARPSARFDHYAMLRTTEQMLGLPTVLGNAATAPSMRRAFHLARVR